MPRLARQVHGETQESAGDKDTDKPRHSFEQVTTNRHSDQLVNFLWLCELFPHWRQRLPGETRANAGNTR